MASKHDVVVTDTDGISNVRLAFEVPAQLYQTKFERIVRGLYFHHTNRILPKNVPVVVDLLNGADVDNPDIQALNKHHIGGEACIYLYGAAGDEFDSSVWVFEFYHAHFVMVRTGATAEDDGG